MSCARGVRPAFSLARPARALPPRTAQRAVLTWAAAAALAALLGLGHTAAQAQTAANTDGALPAAATALNSTVVDAREAARKKDRARLTAARAALAASGHPLTVWAEYWDLSSRLSEATADDIEAFYTRWPATYLEDRLRNDWLLELGRRRDFNALAREFPRFRMNDDREVACWALLTEHLAGRDVSEAARTAWFAQREPDDGCQMLATAMVDAKRFSADDVWRKARLALEAQRPAVAKAAVGLLGPALARDVGDAVDKPAAWLRKSAGLTRNAHELRALALMRLAATDLDAAVAALGDNSAALPRGLAANVWAYVARQSAFKLLPEAASQVQRAWALMPAELPRTLALSDETLAWGVRALLRSPPSALNSGLVQRQIDAMSATEQRDPAWQYWRAKAQLASAAEGTAGEPQRAEARRALEALAGPLGFYPSLAAEDLGLKPPLPTAPAPLTTTEREAAQQSPGLRRAQLLAALGLRDEARREWNYTLRGMADRELLAAARLACDAADWQLCINTAERTKTEVDLALRYPLPYAAEITAAAKGAGLEPAFLAGLIRQETRFMTQLRSHAGATGLMQVMPATGRWVAKKIGLEPARADAALADPATNLLLGSRYLRLVLDDLSGSQAMAAAAYNAGPGRPRRWREGAVLDAAAWTESIPFNETRDYVKKVLTNTAVYAALLDGRKTAPLRPRLGSSIGPRDAAAAPANTELP